MSNTLIKITDISTSGNIHISFIKQLHHNGLIEIITIEQIEFVEEDALPRIEQYHTWYEDLEINMQGIEVIRNLLDKIERLKEEIRALKSSGFYPNGE